MAELDNAADLHDGPGPIVANVLGAEEEPSAELKLARRVRETIAPRPKLAYPAPWRTAETKGDGTVVVVCADGSYAAECPNVPAAEAIVLAVNTFAGVSA